MKTKTLIISTLLLAIVLAPAAMATEERPRGPRGGQAGQGRPVQGRGGFGGQPGSFRGPGGMGGGDMMSRLAGRLDLTEEQQDKIRAIQEEGREGSREAMTAVREAHAALQEAIEEGTDEEITAAGKKLGKAYGKQGVLRAQTARKIESVLTPEQKAELEELKAQMKERMQQRRQELEEQRGQREQRPRPDAGQGQGGRGGRGGRPRGVQE